MNEAPEDPEAAGQPSYRGSIRHIQSEEELHFHAWEDAVEFIRRYVPLRDGDGPNGS